MHARRLNYILWLQDILQASSLGEPVVLEVIRGVDVYELRPTTTSPVLMQ